MLEVEHQKHKNEYKHMSHSIRHELVG